MQCSIKQILSDATDKLNKIGISSPQLEARILLQHVINKPIEYLLINLDEQLNEAEIEAFEKLLERRLKHEPIVYITGVKEFYSREFIVNKHVLIPRSDTEVLVDVVFQCHLRFRGDDISKNCNDKFLNILELGAGSGCIAISLLCELPNANVIATDISLDAIEIIKSNAAKYKVTDRIQIIHSNWFENIETQKFDFIVSNPPYIAHSEKSEMAIETIKYEPSIALFAEKDGLQAYFLIAENAKQFLKPNGKIILEIGFKQEEAVTQIFLDHGYNIESVYKDLQGHSRVILFSPINLNRSYARRIGKSLSGV
ncbi:protein-(glutamine-N5) methyltransferase, release factor-specific [Rickettsia amblyommatis str. Darkwater]|nr:protein-(glutamine-N5) methyltransferase, release factor-specific [Rickettsia amblyommatis str. Darkwater]